MSFKDLLREKIEKEGYVSYGTLVDFTLENEKKVGTMDRRMRELCNEFPIEAIEKKSKRGSLYISGYQWRIVGSTEGFINEIKSYSYSAFPNQKMNVNPFTRGELDELLKHATIGGITVPIFKENKKEKQVEVKRDDLGI